MNLDTVPTGAEVVLVDPAGDVSLGTAPLKRVRVPRGQQTLRFVLAGYEPLEVKLEIGRKAQTLVHTLTRIIQPARVSLLAAEAVRGAAVRVDGEPVGGLPLEVSLAPGRHQVVVSHEAFLPWERWLELEEAEKVSLEVVMKPVPPKTGTLLVVSEPSGAAITYDGLPKGNTPLVMNDAKPGRHVVQLALDGHAPVELVAEVKTGETATVSGRLESLAPKTGSLLVVSTPVGALVTMAGVGRGRTPARVDELGPGSYAVQLDLDGHIPVQLVAKVEAGRTTTIEGRLEAIGPTSGSLKVLLDRSEAEVLLDGRVIGRGNTILEDLAPGAYKLEVRAAGFPTQDRAISVKLGETTRVDVSLEAALASTTTKLIVVAQAPGATVSLDGAAAQPIEQALPPLTPGAHRLVVSAPGHLPWTHAFTAIAGTAVELQAAPRPSGMLKVFAADGRPADVFVNGVQVGSTPWRSEVEAGAHVVAVVREPVHHESTVTVAASGEASVRAVLEQPDAPRVLGTAMPGSAETLGAGRGVVDLFGGWPHLIGAHVAGGVADWLDLGFTYRSAFDVINEFEAEAKFYFADVGVMRFGAQAGAGFGIGAKDRNSFFAEAHALAALHLGTRVALTFRVGLRFYTDQTGPSNQPAHASRDTSVQLPLALHVDVHLFSGFGLFAEVEGDPIPGRRRLYDQGYMVDTSVYARAGASLTF